DAPVSSEYAPMSTRLPTGATANPKLSFTAGVGLVKVLSSVPLMLNRYAAPAFNPAASSNVAPMSNRSLPTAATDPPKKSPLAGGGLVKVVSNAPLVRNR